MSWAKIVTSSPVLWSDGSVFQGTLLLVYLPPLLGAITNYPAIYPRYEMGSRTLPIELPKRLPIPIIDGVLQDNKVLPLDAIDPPNVKFYAIWTNRPGVYIAGSAAVFSISATGDYTITVPTLTVPTAETDNPTITGFLSGA